MSKNLLFTCFASPADGESENLKPKESYYKNACVCLISAKLMNPNLDVMFIVNRLVPQKYRDLLEEADIKILNIPFNNFVFQKNYKWNLAFFKLCAFGEALKLDYDKFVLIDVDTYTSMNLDNVLSELDYSILLYDISHGLNTTNYQEFLKEVYEFQNDLHYITHFGGEFIATNKSNGLDLFEKMVSIYNRMKERNFITTKGDEFILSIAASSFKNVIKNAAPYICRYWTRSFRLINTNYMFNRVCIYHVPSEKKYGLIKIYNYYCRRRSFPRDKKTWKYLHLSKDYFLCKIKRLFEFKK
ncbi:MAG: hypothetical protein K6E21_00295 [Bacilli bacterium]|nr:hypothetical protein [Bacilli bacterium]